VLAASGLDLRTTRLYEAFQQAVGIDMSGPLPFTLQAWLHPLAVFLIMRRRTLPLNGGA